uniref:Scaffold attachment factor B1 n=1 Tax=Lygus hesperus TaxID=30085 RepID=A0A0A9X897_LYGHE
MKRILDSSKTITTCVTGNSKPREYTGRYKHEKRVFDPYQNYLSHPRRSLSVEFPKFRENYPSSNDDLDQAHPLPQRLCMYWSLDEDNKRKLSDPSYVKQAVQETFMQRAHGAYHYRRPSHFPVHTSVSHKTTFAPTQKQVSSKTPKPKPSKPPDKEKHIPKPQVPKRKRFIDTAQPVKHFISKTKILQDRRARLGAELKESSEAQLEALRKKLYDPKPAVLEYLMEKHSPKLSGYQLKTRKDKYLSDTAEPPPPFVQRFFGWKRDEKKTAKEDGDSEEDNIAITPRAIEVRKPTNKQSLSLKRSRKFDESAESSEDGQSEKRKSSVHKSSRYDKKPMTNEERRSKRREAQEAQEREGIIQKIKSVSVVSPRPPQHEHRSIKNQVRDLD